MSHLLPRLLSPSSLSLPLRDAPAPPSPGQPQMEPRTGPGVPHRAEQRGGITSLPSPAAPIPEPGGFWGQKSRSERRSLRWERPERRCPGGPAGGAAARRPLSRAPSAAQPSPRSRAPMRGAEGGGMALWRGLRCCRRAFAWLPVLLIALLLLWSYYGYVCELCLGERPPGPARPWPRLGTAGVPAGLRAGGFGSFPFSLSSSSSPSSPFWSSSSSCPRCEGAPLPAAMRTGRNASVRVEPRRD